MRASPAPAASASTASPSTPIWWNGIATKITRANNLKVWLIPPEQSQALAALAQRTMHIQVTVQDGPCVGGRR